MKEKVMLGMSGGVDSSVAAAVLLESGLEVTGATLVLCADDNGANSRDAAAVCERLGINHLTFDFKKEFSDFVISDFIGKYMCGKTPNPCIECNKHIKFGEMLEAAEIGGYAKIATGHYARVEQTDNGRYLLKKAADPTKDQSYVLYGLTQHQLSHLLLPLGEYTKSQIRDKAKTLGLVNAERPDSQDICFVPDGNYADFIEKVSGVKSQSGDYVDINGNFLGRHSGIIHYTPGQRKGLGIALGRPVFVIEKCSKTNTVVLGDEKYLFKSEVYAENVNYIPFDRLDGEMKVTVKLRYAHTAQPAVIRPYGENGVLIVFDTPQRAPSPGQAAVFYDGDTVVGGGTVV